MSHSNDHARPPPTAGLEHRKAAFLLKAFNLKLDPISGELVLADGKPKPNCHALMKKDHQEIIHILKGHQSGALGQTKS